MYLGARSGFAMLYRRYISPGISASVVNMSELHCSVKSSAMSGRSGRFSAISASRLVADKSGMHSTPLVG